MFNLRFAIADIPKWSSGFPDDGSDARILSEIRPAVLKQGYLTAAEFREICYWKTPRSQARCRQNTTDDIRVLTQASLATRDEALKMDLLRRLRGVDWPTASTLLHFCDARPYPVLPSDTIDIGAPLEGYDPAVSDSLNPGPAPDDSTADQPVPAPY